MKRFKRIISLALAAFLTLSALVTVTNAKQFTDVPSTAPLLDAINYAVDNNFIEGTSSTTFSPNSYMTRGNMVLMLYRHSGETVNSTNTGFTDVPSSSPYARAVNWAVTAEITNGKTPTTFEPDTSIKRQDAAVMMYRYAQYMVHRTDFTSTLADFTDSGRVQDYALEAMQWVVGAGIIGGTSATTLEPRAYLKRGAAAAMLQRYGFSVVIPFDANNAPDDRPHTTNDIFSRDLYGFTNISANFDQSQTGAPFHPNASCYYIDEEDINIMIHYSYETGDVFSDKWDVIDDWILNESWRGSCSGMCVSTILDRAGQINVNSRQSNSQFLSQITQEPAIARVESLINYYQLLQAVRGAEQHFITEDDYMISMFDYILNFGICEFNVFYFSGGEITGHALIAYDAISLGNDQYKICVYDPNFLECNSYFLFRIIYGEVREAFYYPNGNESYIPIIKVAYRSASEVCEDFKSYDIDGDFNTGVPEAATASLDEPNLTIHENASISKKSLFVDMVSESKTTLYVNCNDDFTIINSRGEYLIYDFETFSFSGDMILYRQAATFINGFTHVLTVPADDSYEVITSADKVCFNVLSQNSFNGIKTNNAKNIKISENDEIIVSGDNAVVYSSYGTAKVSITKEIK